MAVAFPRLKIINLIPELMTKSQDKHSVTSYRVELEERERQNVTRKLRKVTTRFSFDAFSRHMKLVLTLYHIPWSTSKTDLIALLWSVEV